MKATRTVTWISSNGKTVEVKIERNKKVEDNISYADGWNINLGKKTVDLLKIEVYMDGKYITYALHAPHVIDKNSYFKSYQELRDKGAYARLGNVYIGEENYNLVMAALTEIEAELTEAPEFEEVKAQEEAREAQKEAAFEAEITEYQRELKNGLCPKCGTYCYGDCEAH
jgi:predicted DNA binding protein